LDLAQALRGASPAREGAQVAREIPHLLAAGLAEIAFGVQPREVALGAVEKVHALPRGQAHARELPSAEEDRRRVVDERWEAQSRDLPAAPRNLDLSQEEGLVRVRIDEQRVTSLVDEEGLDPRSAGSAGDVVGGEVAAPAGGARFVAELGRPLLDPF